MGQQTELQELIQIERDRLVVAEEEKNLARKQAEIEIIQAKNEEVRLKQAHQRYIQEERRLELEAQRNVQIEEALHWVRQIQSDHHEPIMQGLKGIDDKTAVLLQILQITIPVLIRENGSEKDQLKELARLLNTERQDLNINVGTNVQTQGDLTTQDIVGGEKVHERIKNR